MASHGMVDVSAPSPPSVLRKPLEVMVGGLLPDLHSNHLDLKANLRLSGLYIRFLTRCDKSRCSLLGGWDPQSSGGGRVGGSLGLGGLYAIALNLIFLQKETPGEKQSLFYHAYVLTNNLISFSLLLQTPVSPSTLLLCFLSIFQASRHISLF